MGALYGLLGKVSPVRVEIDHAVCDECKVCARYCITPRILDPPIDRETTAVISADCTLCGRQKLFSHRGGDRGRQVGFLGMKA